MSYNPNEIVRCRHLVSLAEHIGDKLELILNGAVAAEDTRPTPTLTLAETTMTLANFKSAITTDGGEHDISYTYSGDGVVYAYITDPMSVNLGVNTIQNATKLRLTSMNINNIRACTVHVCAEGTDNYKPVEATFTITE